MLLAGCGEDTRKALGMGKNPPDEFQVVGRAPLSMPPDYKLRPPVPGAARPQEVSPNANAKAIVLGGTAQPQGQPQDASDNPQTASVTPVNDPPTPNPAPRTPVAAATIGATPPAQTSQFVYSGILGQSSAAAAAKVASAQPAGAQTASATLAAPAPSGGPSSGEQALLGRLGTDKAIPNIRSLLTEELTKLADANETTIDKLLWWKKPEPPVAILDANQESQRLQGNAALGKPPTDGDSPSIKKVSKALFDW
jgi:hypothetical protein